MVKKNTILNPKIQYDFFSLLFASGENSRSIFCSTLSLLSVPDPGMFVCLSIIFALYVKIHMKYMLLPLMMLMLMLILQ